MYIFTALWRFTENVGYISNTYINIHIRIIFIYILKLIYLLINNYKYN